MEIFGRKLRFGLLLACNLLLLQFLDFELELIKM